MATAIENNTEELQELLQIANSLPSSQKYGKAVFLGDSLGEGYLNNNYSFIDILSEKGVFESVAKHCVAGATIGPYSADSAIDTYCLTQQIDRYTSDIRNADIIFIEYGGNDMYAVIESRVLPGYSTDPSSETTICGYARKAFERIRALNSTARLVWLAPTRYKGWSDATTWQMYDVLLMFEASLYRVAAEYSANIIDLTEGLPLQSLTVDGMHPTTEGHKIVAQNVINNLFVNTPPAPLKRTYTLTMDANGNVSCSDGAFLSCFALLNYGVDVTVTSTTSGATLIATPRFYSQWEIFFESYAWFETSFVHYRISWKPDETFGFSTGLG